MLSHDNLTWDAFAAAKYLKLEEGVNSIVSFLPLSHIAAQVQLWCLVLFVTCYCRSFTINYI